MPLIPEPIPSRFPLVLACDEAAKPTITATACYPNDGPLGSITFDTRTDKARGVLFLISQNGNDPEAIPKATLLAAINAIL
jgi:hypothetical protein